MGRRSLTREEAQQEANLSQALEARLPGIISWLSEEVRQRMSDHIIGIIGTPQGRVSQGSINHMQYNWLIEHGHMNNITPEQALKVTEEQDHVMSNWKELF